MASPVPPRPGATARVPVAADQPPAGAAEAITGLADEHAWLAAIAERGEAAVVSQPGTDGRLRVVWCNDGFCDLLGYAPEELLGSQTGGLVPEEQRHDVIRRVADVVTAGGTCHEELELLCGDGSRLPVSVEYFLVPGEPPSFVAIYHDLTDRERARRNEVWAETILRQGHDLLMVTDRSGIASFVSRSVVGALGYRPAELVGTNVFELLHPDDVGPALGAFVEAVDGVATGTPTSLRARHADGSWRHLDVQATVLLDDPAVRGVLLTARDVTERHQAEQLAAEHAELLEGVARGMPLEATLFRIAKLVERRIPRSRCTIGKADGDGVIRVVVAPSLDRTAVRAVDEVQPDSALGRSLRGQGSAPVFFGDLAADPRWGELGRRFAGHGIRACWVMRITGPGSDELLGDIAVYLPDDRRPAEAERQLLELATSLSAVAIERRRFESALEHQALHDSLTGLPNRTLLLDRIDLALARAQRLGRHIAVLFVDLDGFKLINDSLGHAAGDHLLRQVAERFAGAIRAGDTVGRFGGDEFLVLCEEVDDEAAAMAVAERLAFELEAPLQVADSEAFVRASVGIALAEPGDESISAESLVRNADVAMYRAKEGGRDRACLFEEDLHRQVVARVSLERDLHRALQDDQLVLHYQPIVRLSDAHVVGAEALVRWERPGHGLVSPGEFVPLAEDTGLIVPIGRWVLERACRQAARWAELPDGPMEMSVNLSGRQLARPQLLAEVEAVIDETGVDPSLLCFEVTETTLADDEALVDALHRLKDLGVRLAIDDFGTGYATLEHVRRFAMADQLKIDRSFVAGIEDGRSPDVAIVSAVIVLAGALGFTVVAEGVETEVQLGVLRGLGCDRAQGYHFARPARARDLRELLRARTLG